MTAGSQENPIQQVSENTDKAKVTWGRWDGHCWDAREERRWGTLPYGSPVAPALPWQTQKQEESMHACPYLGKPEGIKWETQPMRHFDCVSSRDTLVFGSLSSNTPPHLLTPSLTALLHLFNETFCPVYY